MLRKPLTVVLALFVLGTSTAQAQDAPNPEEFTPKGYEFCGWRDSQAPSGWTTEWGEHLVGAYQMAFARGMTCQAARRNVTRMRYSRRPPYRPIRPGYRCKTLGAEHEFSDVRCAKRGKPDTAFRVRSGA